MDTTEPKVKRALPLLNDKGRRLAFGGSFALDPIYEDWPGYAAAMARRAAMDAKAERARQEGVMQSAQYWKRIHHSDPRALEMADRHYSRQSPGTPEFTPSGHKIVLMHFDGDRPAALWASHRPAPGKAVRADGLDAWACTLFRIERRTVMASVLIREAVAITRGLWTPLPTDGFYTTINPDKVAPIMRRGCPLWGYCYLKAGWQLRDERTKDKNLIVLTLPFDTLAAYTSIKVDTAMPPWGMAWRRWARKCSDHQRNLFEDIA